MSLSGDHCHMSLLGFAKRTRVGRRVTSLKAATAPHVGVLRHSLRQEPDHYDRLLPRDRAVALFKRHVELIEVETTSYCNRTCSFCPNSSIDRRSEKVIMPEACWDNILRDLHDCDYDGSFFWCRYSEPLSERRIIERIAEVRRAAPQSHICIDSNGDYLDGAFLAELVAAGLDYLLVDLYMPDADTYDLDAARDYHERFLERIGASATIQTTVPELSSRIDAIGIQVIVVVRNSASMQRGMSNRGGLVTHARRTQRVAPCYAPSRHLVIDWDGSVVACCQVRSDVAQHRDAVVAQVGVNGVGLIEAYAALAHWRDALRAFGPKTGPCATCTVAEYPMTWLTRTAVGTLTGESTLGVRAAKRAAGAVVRKARHWHGPGS